MSLSLPFQKCINEESIEIQSFRMLCSISGMLQIFLRLKTEFHIHFCLTVSDGSGWSVMLMSNVLLTNSLRTINSVELHGY